MAKTCRGKFDRHYTDKFDLLRHYANETLSIIRKFLIIKW